MPLLSFCGGVGGWGGWSLQSHFRVQPNYSVEVVLLVVLCCRWSCDNSQLPSTTLNHSVRSTVPIYLNLLQATLKYNLPTNLLIAKYLYCII